MALIKQGYVTPAIRLDESGMWVLRKFHEAEIERLREENENLVEELRDASPGWLAAADELKRQRLALRELYEGMMEDNMPGAALVEWHARHPWAKAIVRGECPACGGTGVEPCREGDPLYECAECFDD